MFGAVFDAGTARDAFFCIDHTTVFRIDSPDRASLCTSPTLGTRIADRNKINIPKLRISLVRMTRLSTVRVTAGDFYFRNLVG